MANKISLKKYLSLLLVCLNPSTNKKAKIGKLTLPIILKISIFGYIIAPIWSIVIVIIASIFKSKLERNFFILPPNIQIIGNLLVFSSLSHVLYFQY